MTWDNDRREDAEQHRRTEQDRIEATRRAEERRTYEMEDLRRDGRDHPDRSLQ